MPPPRPTRSCEPFLPARPSVGRQRRGRVVRLGRDSRRLHSPGRGASGHRTDDPRRRLRPCRPPRRRARQQTGRHRTGRLRVDRRRPRTRSGRNSHPPHRPRLKASLRARATHTRLPIRAPPQVDRHAERDHSGIGTRSDPVRDPSAGRLPRSPSPQPRSASGTPGVLAPSMERAGSTSDHPAPRMSSCRMR
jgi:hypothetical protein